MAKPADVVLENQVRRIYDSFTPVEISARITDLVRPKGIEWKGEIEIISSRSRTSMRATASPG